MKTVTTTVIGFTLGLSALLGACEDPKRLTGEPCCNDKECHKSAYCSPEGLCASSHRLDGLPRDATGRDEGTRMELALTLCREGDAGACHEVAEGLVLPTSDVVQMEAGVQWRKRG